MLTGDEQIWKEVQESLKKIEELKAHWSILSPAGRAALLVVALPEVEPRQSLKVQVLLLRPSQQCGEWPSGGERPRKTKARSAQMPYKYLTTSEW